MNGKLIIFSAPSGSGKSTIINYLLKQNLNLAFSISATSRPPRGEEAGQNVVFDVDVVGGCNIKKFYGDRALSLFIQPPCVEELRRRLIGRGTDAPEVIEHRVAKAEYELSFASKFDKVIINDDLEAAKAETLKVIKEFLNK